MAAGRVIPAVIDLLAAQSATRPDDPAIVADGTTITFRELDQRVASLSSVVSNECPPTSWLPVIVDRSIDSIIAVLAAIRAGRPHVPIDSSLPRSRIADLITRAGDSTVAVIARPEFASHLPDSVRSVDSRSHQGSTIPPVPVDGDRPGSLIFTSGSTGEPKGVVRMWKATDAVALRRSQEMNSCPERIALIRPLSFSGGLNEAMRVCAGDTLCLEDPRAQSSDAFFARLARLEVTDVALGQALSEALLRIATRTLPRVRTYSVFGMTSSWSDVARIRATCAPDVVVTNQYNATEIGCAAFFRIEPGEPLGLGPIPVGHIDQAPRVRFEDDDGRLEMWIRDPYAVGYLADATTSHDKFIVDEDGTRWWRSGDIGRLDDRGFLYLVGRTDDMVKIHGVRVEPAETEKVLRAISGISDATVLVHRSSRGEQRLIGHVCTTDPRLTPENVRSTLSASLPAHQIPAFFVRHEALPYNERLKLDRRALLGTPLERWRSTTPITTYHLPVLWIAAKVGEIIGLGDVAPNDDVWEAGLDSMGAVELCSAIAAQGLGDLAPTDLLTHRTPIDLERRSSAHRILATSPAVVFNDAGSLPPIFAVPGSGGTSFAFRSLAASLGDDQPLIVIEPVGMHCRGRVERTLADRVRTAMAEISHRTNEGESCIIVGYSGGATIAVETARACGEYGLEPHLVLLDGAPRDGHHNSFSIDWRGRILPQRPADATGRDIARWALARLQHSARNMLDLPGSARLRLRPGERRFTKEYYDVFKRRDRLAIDRHELRSFDGPTTLVHIEGSSAPTACEPWFTDLTCLQVGGGHYSMLHTPHVDEIARHIERVRAEMTVRY